MDTSEAGNSQENLILHLSPSQSQTAIAALAFSIKDSLRTLEYNWGPDAYSDLTSSLGEILGSINRIASQIEKSRTLLARLSAHLSDPCTSLELSDAELEQLGYALYSYGVTGFQRALHATRTNISFANSNAMSCAIDKLNQQNQRAFALFKWLEQFKRNVSWMVWLQANSDRAESVR